MNTAVFAHITAAGLDAGLTPERLNRVIERHERNTRRNTITLAPSEFCWMDDHKRSTPPSGCAPAQEVSQ